MCMRTSGFIFRFLYFYWLFGKSSADLKRTLFPMTFLTKDWIGRKVSYYRPYSLVWFRPTIFLFWIIPGFLMIDLRCNLCVVPLFFRVNRDYHLTARKSPNLHQSVFQLYRWIWQKCFPVINFRRRLSHSIGVGCWLFPVRAHRRENKFSKQSWFGWVMNFTSWSFMVSCRTLIEQVDIRITCKREEERTWSWLSFFSPTNSIESFY